MAKLTPKQQWFAAFERAVNQALPETCGKIDWDAATFFINSGLSIDAAAARYVVRIMEDKNKT